MPPTANAVTLRTMFVYAGIDEAGYGPLFGPLLVGRAVFVLPDHPTPNEPPALWQTLAKVVCRKPNDKRRRIAVNDSKKLTTPAAGLRHLETGCLAFAGAAGHAPATLDNWLACLGERCHETLDHLPWYAPCNDRPWNAIPTCVDAGELAIARNMLTAGCKHAGVTVADVGAAVVLEDRFNKMVAATRSKAATSFTFVANHLQHIWQTHGQHAPFVAVDRQGGRTHYRELLAINFPDTAMTVLEETPRRSAYRLQTGDRSMTVTFEVDAEQAHMPVALASMISKYTRELLMTRFNAYFTSHLPDVAPTAGYATDAKRFYRDIEPALATLGITREMLCRQA
ncbi:hypothetical protein ACERK3_08490 [Phycisphaerales bacterium AB-hyl4]|uniref:Uncharacterized protein n=1 Tax=Natronomicrosphaera hydrolytica TaxID=3242702 RepID=A0ABV4U651_9BACT